MEKLEGAKGGLKMENEERERYEEDEREGNEGLDFLVEIHGLCKEINFWDCLERGINIKYHVLECVIIILSLVTKICFFNFFP